MVLRRIGPLSLAKIMGVSYAILGLIAGALFSLFAVLGSALSALGGEGDAGGLFAGLFGIGAIIALPIFYGILGFVCGLVGAAVYNLLAGWMGGVEVELGEGRPAA